MKDVRWLGFEWDGLYYASDYFDQLYEWAVKLIKDGKAYVDDLTRGGNSPASRHPDRARQRQSVSQPSSVKENLDLFERMRKGEFPDGSRVLRAKIDMASPNLNMRDPVMYRILHAEHHRTGDKWCIYPMYDYAHGQSDSIEHVTHSICTLEFEDHRPLYNWFIQQLGIFPSQQIEFDRLNLTYTLLSKRKLLKLVQEKLRQRLGRSAHADALGHSPARLHAGGDPQFLRGHRSVEDQRHARTGDARALRPRRPEQARAARDGRAAAAESRDRQLSGRPGRGSRRGQQSRGRKRRQAQSAVLAKCSTSSRTISAKIRRSSISACRPAAKCACATAISSRRRRW